MILTNMSGTEEQLRPWGTCCLLAFDTPPAEGNRLPPVNIAPRPWGAWLLPVFDAPSAEENRLPPLNNVLYLLDACTDFGSCHIPCNLIWLVIKPHSYFTADS